MITWVTVWVLTVTNRMDSANTNYQLQYASQQICKEQIKNHVGNGKTARCDFQQIPVVTK